MWFNRAVTLTLATSLLLFAEYAISDGLSVEVDTRFSVEGQPISPQCLLSITPLASGDVQASEVPIRVPGLRGCSDGNFGASKQDPKLGLVAIAPDGRLVAYRILAQRGVNFLLRVSVAEQGTLIQWTDLWIQVRSRPLRHVMTNGRFTSTVIGVLTLEALHMPKSGDEPSVLMNPFNRATK